jgi:nitrite reductase (NADH) large subunit
MAETAVAHLPTDEKKSFTGADLSTKLKLLGVDVASIGDAQANGPHETVILSDSRAGVYKKLIIDPRTNTLTGAILVGDTGEFRRLLQFHLQHSPLPAMPESLIAKGGAEAGAGVESLPDDAQICSCENVSKGQIVTAVANNCHDIPTLKSGTKAGTGCGSCVPLLKDLLTAELEKAGVATDHSLCEHFAYTRPELVQIVKAARIETFDELLGRYGRGGDGCEICKPVVASILASYQNDYILAHQHIQDTNDTYLANIQRNGTYSVVPRVPGGEITPEQLIAIGEIARDFHLYTKITGGQRIDLFGARLEELPQIWARLQAVGMESGHAYAKGLRTVKSCVGQAWCRFGVQDSTALAIRIENRYKGIRFPHKVKMAVSGCARECAEAQSKDVGVIASERGWNLYLCGNGGMKPQHALLFATDLDEETLICVIDRFLMYYTRTADRLMRTATWLNKLPGGLEHLRQVILEDSLEICAELETEMAHLVNTYQDEWATTLADPAKLKRFKHFLNVPAGDPTIQFEMVRGQRQPVIGKR